ncbi:hypothetical protein BHE74_00003367 [Ensete ventricosum]|uniref:Uncharacterized protein n=1 Tax=Ensete ventricosum TaxID=4639 RepID=A0A427BAI5_ENSVE|nr:hypothetical protein B296_00001568 [Ensete ventricosum]RWW87780.1 hypothetical protein BHE74_00003367 [Ensete ventricosum]
MEAHLAVMAEPRLFLNLGGAEISVATVVETAAEVSLGASGRRRLGLLAEEDEREEEVEGEEGTCSHDPSVWTFMAASTYELCERMDMKATSSVFILCVREVVRQERQRYTSDLHFNMENSHVA